MIPKYAIINEFKPYVKCIILNLKTNHSTNLLLRLKTAILIPQLKDTHLLKKKGRIFMKLNQTATRAKRKLLKPKCK